MGRKTSMNLPARRLFALLACACVALSGGACEDPQQALYEQYHANVASVGPLTDAMVLRYIDAYGRLRERGIEFEAWLAEDPARQGEAFAHLEEAIRAGGFADYAEFVRVNAKIAWAWNMAQAERGYASQERLNQWGQNETDRAIAMLEETIADPQVPEETKAELRAQIKALLEQKQTLRDSWEHNSKWARWSMELTKPLTSEEEVEVVLRHERALMEVFTDLSPEQLDAIHSNSMQQLGVE